MVHVQKIAFSLFVWSSVMMCSSHECALIEIGSPTKRRAEILNTFNDVHVLGQVSPREIVAKGLLPEIFFKECVLRTEPNEVAEAWLRNFFGDLDVESSVSQDSLDDMLRSVSRKLDASPGLVKQLLSYGADPCVGVSPPIAYTFNRLSEGKGGVGPMSEKLCAMVEFVCNDVKFLPYVDKGYGVITQRLIDGITMRQDYKNELRDKFGEFGKAQSDKACYEHCDIWIKICQLLKERPMRGSNYVQNSPFKRKKTAFDIFATRCMDACIARDIKP